MQINTLLIFDILFNIYTFINLIMSTAKSNSNNVFNIKIRGFIKLLTSSFHFKGQVGKFILINFRNEKRKTEIFSTFKFQN